MKMYVVRLLVQAAIRRLIKRGYSMRTRLIIAGEMVKMRSQAQRFCYMLRLALI